MATLPKDQQTVNIQEITPRVVDQMIVQRVAKTSYVSGGNTIACDVMLEIVWQGRRYLIPAFER
jgi:hypothetical protein